MTAFDAALKRLNFTLTQYLAHPGNPEIALAWLRAVWAWDEFKRGQKEKAHERG